MSAEDLIETIRLIERMKAPINQLENAPPPAFNGATRLHAAPDVFVKLAAIADEQARLHAGPHVTVLLDPRMPCGFALGTLRGDVVFILTPKKAVSIREGLPFAELGMSIDDLVATAGVL